MQRLYFLKSGWYFCYGIILLLFPFREATFSEVWYLLGDWCSAASVVHHGWVWKSHSTLGYSKCPPRTILPCTDADGIHCYVAFEWHRRRRFLICLCDLEIFVIVRLIILCRVQVVYIVLEHGRWHNRVALQIQDRSQKSRPVSSLNQSQTQMTRPVATGLALQRAPGLPSIQEIIDNWHLALFGHGVRLDARIILAPQALKLFAAMRSDLTSAGLELQDVHATHGFSKLVMEHH